MKKYQEKLNVVDENNNIIDEETRENIHKKGLLHREIHIWIYNKNIDILFQRRAPDKDTFPDLLDAFVGGHVDLGESYDEAAIKKLEEETGIIAKKEDLTFLRETRTKHYDSITNTTNNVIRAIYAYKFNGNINELKIEDGKATSLEFWSLDKLLNLTDEEKIKFISFNWEKRLLPIFKQIQDLNKK
ncbi:MAG: NUDIX domain-containing protein [Patescibacteria group bacterium]